MVLDLQKPISAMMVIWIIELGSWPFFIAVLHNKIFVIFSNVYHGHGMFHYKPNLRFKKENYRSICLVH